MKTKKLLSFMTMMAAAMLLSFSPAIAQDDDPWSEEEGATECGKRAITVWVDDPYPDQHTLTMQLQAPHPHYSYDLYMAREANEEGTLKGKLVLTAHEGKHTGQLAYVFIDEVIVIPEGTKEIWIKTDKDFPWGANNFRGNIDLDEEYFCIKSFFLDEDVEK